MQTPTQTIYSSIKKQILQLLLFSVLAVLQSSSAFGQIQCWNDSTGLIPLVDLGINYYEGHQGGLYPMGTNTMPAAHRKKGINISKNLKPLDSLGNVDYEEGKIIFLGLGASLASNAFLAYSDSLSDTYYTTLNNCLDVKGMFFGGKDLDQMIDFENNAYWESVEDKMVARGDHYEQVQVIWVMQQSFLDTTTNFDTYYTSVSNKYLTLMQVLKDTFPNLKQVYLSGVHYMGYMDPLHFRYNAFREPHGYWGNLVIKELIAKQILGDPALSYLGPGAKSAWLSWGPNFWADGKNERIYDGLSWKCTQYRTDETGGGFHLVDSGFALGVEAQMMLDFFTYNPVAKIWHQDGPLWAACPEDTLKTANSMLYPEELSIYPNPAQNTLFIKLPEHVQGNYTVVIVNDIGAEVFKQTYTDYIGNSVIIKFNVPDGMYIVKVANNQVAYASKCIVYN